MNMRMLLAPCMAAAALLISACSLEPWVKPYEREHMADIVMNIGRDALADKHRAHVYEIREAARGATAAQGGGCGCN